MTRFFKSVIAINLAFLLSGCGTNPATGERQFAALMSPQQEASVGAEENAKIMRQFGGTVKNQALADYVTRVGQRVAKNTERADVRYQFFVLDTPTVNAFALPGGYVYVTRGVLALADNEAQLAAVIAHEIGHVTARHAAERYSHGMATSLGAAILGAAVGNSTAAQVANLGSDLYITSYSRKQESQADELGVRYLDRAGYDTRAMAQFLGNLARSSQLEALDQGTREPAFSYFSTHPQTADRAAQATALAAAYPANARETGDAAYLQAIDGMTYGDSNDQGLVRGTTYYHPQMGFTFTAPAGSVIVNNPNEVVVRHAASGAVAIFDSAANPKGEDPMSYLTTLWMKGEHTAGAENITINGKLAATAEFPGTINKHPMNVRLVAVQWAPTTVFRFQIAVPPGTDAASVAAMRQMAASLRPITAAEQQSIRPYRLKMVTARPGDSVASLAHNYALKTYQEQRFRVLNGLGDGDAVVAGKMYKIVSE